MSTGRAPPAGGTGRRPRRSIWDTSPGTVGAGSRRSCWLASAVLLLLLLLLLLLVVAAAVVLLAVLVLVLQVVVAALVALGWR